MPPLPGPPMDTLLRIGKFGIRNTDIFFWFFTLPSSSNVPRDVCRKYMHMACGLACLNVARLVTVYVLIGNNYFAENSVGWLVFRIELMVNFHKFEAHPHVSDHTRWEEQTTVEGGTAESWWEVGQGNCTRRVYHPDYYYSSLCPASSVQRGFVYL